MEPSQQISLHVCLTFWVDKVPEDLENLTVEKMRGCLCNGNQPLSRELVAWETESIDEV